MPPKAQGRALSLSRHHAVRVVLVHVTFGPYHVARARALLGVEDLDVTFIEVAQSLGTHPWRNERGVPLLRLAEGEFQDYSTLTLSRLMRRALDRLAPDVVVSCGYGLGVMRAAATWARRKARASVLLHETTYGDRPRHWWKERLKRRLVRHLYDAALCGGDRHRSYINELGIPLERIWTPYDVVDNEYYRTGAEYIRTQSDTWRSYLRLPATPYFLYVGRFAPEKNLMRLLDAFALYSNEVETPWPLILVGDGPCRRSLGRHIEQLRLESLVAIHPFAQSDRLLAYYGLAGCFVLPSVSEPWGLVANEAAASGLPLVVSEKCGCVPELIREGDNGYLIEPTDKDQMAASLTRIAATGAADRGKMANRSQTLVSELSLDAYAENLRACIHTAVTG